MRTSLQFNRILNIEYRTKNVELLSFFPSKFNIPCSTFDISLLRAIAFKSEISNVEQGILNFEGKKLNNSTFFVRYSIFNIRLNCKIVIQWIKHGHYRLLVCNAS